MPAGSRPVTVLVDMREFRRYVPVVGAAADRYVAVVRAGQIVAARSAEACVYECRCHGATAVDVITLKLNDATSGLQNRAAQRFEPDA